MNKGILMEAINITMIRYLVIPLVFICQKIQ